MSNAARRSDRRVATVPEEGAGGRSERDEGATPGCGSDTAHLPCLFLDDAKVAFASGNTSEPALGRDEGDAGASTRRTFREGEEWRFASSRWARERDAGRARTVCAPEGRRFRASCARWRETRQPRRRARWSARWDGGKRRHPLITFPRVTTRIVKSRAHTRVSLKPKTTRRKDDPDETRVDRDALLSMNVPRSNAEFANARRWFLPPRLLTRKPARICRDATTRRGREARPCRSRTATTRWVSRRRTRSDPSVVRAL